MKKTIAAAVIVIAFVGYVVYRERSGQGNENMPIPTQEQAMASSTVVYKDGTYTGSVADAYYGSLQVQAVIANGKLTNVNFLKYPNTSGHTLQVSQEAMPVLKSEAIQAQSAAVNIVSGATQTSQAFQQSLTVALALAQQ